MPHLDRVTIFSQIFWLFIIFTFSYIILTHFFLPKFLSSLKARKQIIDLNDFEVLTITNKLTEQQMILEQTILKNLVLIENIARYELGVQNVNKEILNTQTIDEKIAIILLNNTLYCNFQLLDSVLLYPKGLNFKFK